VFNLEILSAQESSVFRVVVLLFVVVAVVPSDSFYE
jgi:hypothetical protein